MKKTAAVTLAVVFVLSLMAQAQYTIRTETAMQGFNPLNPSQVKHPVITGRTQTPTQLLGSFEVTNYADKTVIEIEYGWRIAAPYTCIDSDMKAKWDHAIAKVDLPPGKSVEVDADVKLSAAGTNKLVANEASRHKTPVVLVTVGLLKVTYADGTTWSDEEAQSRQMFDGGMHEKLTQCQAGIQPSAKCGQSDPLARLNMDEISRKGGGNGSSCISRNCNVSQFLNGTCQWAICVVSCCGDGCFSPCNAYCSPYWWPWNCNEQYY